MRVKFSKSVEYIPEWKKNRDLPEAEQVRVTIKPMKMQDLMVLLDDLQRAAADGQLAVTDAEAPSNVVKIKELLKSSGHLLPRYATVHNLFNGDDEPVGIEDVVDYPHFMGLAAEVLSYLAARAMPNEEERKN